MEKPYPESRTVLTTTTAVEPPPVLIREAIVPQTARSPSPDGVPKAGAFACDLGGVWGWRT